jgi:hypothetical protein
MLSVCTKLSCLSLAFVRVRVVYLVSTVFGDGSFVRTLRSGLKWLGGDESSADGERPGVFAEINLVSKISTIGGCTYAHSSH